MKRNDASPPAEFSKSARRDRLFSHAARAAPPAELRWSLPLRSITPLIMFKSGVTRRPRTHSPLRRIGHAAGPLYTSNGTSSLLCNFADVIGETRSERTAGIIADEYYSRCLRQNDLSFACRSKKISGSFERLVIPHLFHAFIYLNPNKLTLYL